MRLSQIKLLLLVLMLAMWLPDCIASSRTGTNFVELLKHTNLLSKPKNEGYQPNCYVTCTICDWNISCSFLLRWNLKARFSAKQLYESEPCLPGQLLKQSPVMGCGQLFGAAHPQAGLAIKPIQNMINLKQNWVKWHNAVKNKICKNNLTSGNAACSSSSIATWSVATKMVLGNSLSVSSAR